MSPELIQHPCCELVKIIFCVVTASNACLVCNDNEAKTCLAHLPTCAENAINKMEILNPVDILAFLIDDTITIKENCPLRRHY
jgi:hypothetical protein